MPAMVAAPAQASAQAFLLKKKNKRPTRSFTGTGMAAAPLTSAPTRVSPPRTIRPVPQAQPVAPPPPPSDPSKITEIKLFSVSAAIREETRFNMMKLNYAREFDPTTIPGPILMNRKQPGPRAPPTLAYDEEGNIVGKFKYDHEGKPVLGPDGTHVVEQKEQADLSLIGGSDAKKVRKKAIKEVYHQDKEVMRLRREEATPWVLESGAQKDENETEGVQGGKAPEHWVGRYVEPHALPTILLVSDEHVEGFQVIPVGRNYKFEPERPFKVLDPDAAHKFFEHQTKNKSHDRWAQREGGRAGAHIAAPQQQGAARVKQERGLDLRREARAREIEQRMFQRSGNASRSVKVERFEDDDRREGRGLGRGLDGGVDEELDYDEKEDFQDDDDVNTFHHDREEEEETKATEERLKKEYRIANATVGDRPQIGKELDDEEDLFGDKDLTRDGRKLRRALRKRMGSEELFGASDDDSDESEDEADAKKKEAEKAKEKEKEKETKVPGSAERPRGPAGSNRSERGATSPGQHRNMSPAPTKGKSSTAPPQSGASLVARRATSRGASPSIRSRHASPRAASPDAGSSGARSPRAGSPVVSRGQSPVIDQGTGREASPGGSVNASRPTIKLKNPLASASASASSTGSPAPSPNGKRKNSPAPSGDGSRKKKKGSNTPTPAPEDIEPFEGMITRDEIIAWFRRQPTDRIPMKEAVAAFSPRLRVLPKELQARGSKLFMMWVGQVTVKAGDSILQFKEEFK